MCAAFVEGTPRKLSSSGLNASYSLTKFGILYTTVVLFGQITDKQKDLYYKSCVYRVCTTCHSHFVASTNIRARITRGNSCNQASTEQSHGERGTAQTQTARYKFDLASPDSAIRKETPIRAWE